MSIKKAASAAFGGILLQMAYFYPIMRTAFVFVAIVFVALQVAVLTVA